MKIEASALTNRGNRRRKNEDNLFFQGQYFPEEKDNMKEVLSITEDTDHGLLFAVFDGLGSIRGGEIASYASAKIMDEMFTDYQNNEKKEASHLFLEKVCSRMNQNVNQLARERIADFATTVSTLLLTGNQVTGCNVGDSPIYILRGGKLTSFYEEHTDRDKRKNCRICRKPVLTQCIGMPEEIIQLCPYIHTIQLMPQDQFLICSDGLTDMISEDEIEEIMSSPDWQEEKVKKLMDLALNRGGKDNITIVLIEQKES